MKRSARASTATAEIPVFLISLKAGGTGLNLTGADMVIHFDPWWNPAVEDQATDRAHRIGQKRTVYSVKLITKRHAWKRRCLSCSGASARSSTPEVRPSPSHSPFTGDGVTPPRPHYTSARWRCPPVRPRPLHPPRTMLRSTLC
jgi:hypothetical protein